VGLGARGVGKSKAASEARDFLGEDDEFLEENVRSLLLDELSTKKGEDDIRVLEYRPSRVVQEPAELSSVL
jgi:hypothetical protein